MRTLRLALVLVVAIMLHSVAFAQEAFRPQYHFTPNKNWINDPNGLVYHNGEFHLFYQYNPQGDTWGHMSWGHAVSRDLLTWDELPLALAEDKDAMIFSGSAVVDHANTSGFGKAGKPPLVAIYTAHHTKNPLQNQHIAFSTDNGRTWTKYDKNPVLDIGEKDFRDPKVIWHEASKVWVMAVAWPEKRQVRFYSSADLKTWKHLSDFGPAGSTEGIWECPDLFPLTLDGKTRWVLIVNVGSGAPAGGSGGQYFVGDFDGTTFTPDETHPKQKGEALWLDRGPDSYAAVTFSDVPAKDGRRLSIGWMSNWQYAGDIPTKPWRNAMTVPRELTLKQTQAGPRLVSLPVKELGSTLGKAKRFAGGTGAEATAWARKEGVKSEPMDLKLTFAAATQKNAGVKLFAGEGEETIVSVDRDKGLVVIDRTHSGNTKFHPKFAGFCTAPLPDPKAEVSLRILVDACSVEVFVNDGADVLTALTFPSEASKGLEFFTVEGATIGAMETRPITVRRKTANRVKAAEFSLKISGEIDEDSTETLGKLTTLFYQCYPKLVERFENPTKPAPREIRLLLKSRLEVPAYCSGDQITISLDWLRKHPDDIALLTHELMHAVQAYPRGAPGWMTEGLADYARQVFGPKVQPEWALPSRLSAKQKHTDSYRVTGRFLLWLDETHPGVVDRLHRRLQDREFEIGDFKTFAGASVEDLWKQCVTDTNKK